jgi:hypothetical protein
LLAGFGRSVGFGSVAPQKARTTPANLQLFPISRFDDLRRTTAHDVRRSLDGYMQQFECYASVEQHDIAEAMKKLQVSEQELGNNYSSGYSLADRAAVAKPRNVN